MYLRVNDNSDQDSAYPKGDAQHLSCVGSALGLLHQERVLQYKKKCNRTLGIALILKFK